MDQLSKLAAPMSGDPPPLMGAEFLRLQQLAMDDAERAWGDIVQFVRVAESPLEVIALLEDFVDRHCRRFLDRLIEAADSDAQFAEALASIHLGDMDGPEFDLLGEWQDQYRMRRLAPP